MPGGRLTTQERQQIALGLADDLPYAEIARRLDRPTSTITREVMRNGGPVAYRADLAHRATEQRAHRRRQAAPRGPQAHGQDARAVDEFEESLAALFVRQGLPRMTAGVLACLYTTDTGSVTAADLVRRLRVSPASVSKSVAFLEGQGLIRRERDEGRRERYVVDPDVWYQSMISSARSSADMAVAFRSGAAVLSPGAPAAVRLENMARYVDFVAESLATAAEQARALLHGGVDERAAGSPEVSGGSASVAP
ncbi:helix-turn-helix domain-containing protein [Actinosynnema pretiosum]|uniref:helix-turn-helix domain-containing protein n=1 Tax=Actinosynnema pretiosum TaxID=42197 RepID=UPI003CD077E1